MAQEVTGFVVLAEFEVSREVKSEFLELCRFDSVRSTTDEVGCKQFDVVVSEESPHSVVLYEVYDDRAAFDTHQTTPHYAVFAAGLDRMGIEAKLVRFFARQSVIGS